MKPKCQILNIMSALMFVTAACAVNAGEARVIVVPDLTVTDQDNKKLRMASDVLGTGPVVVSFFFAGCSSVCPMQTAALRQAQKTLNIEAIRFVSISVDPLNDTPQQLTRFAQQHRLDKSWRLVTLEPHDLDKLLGAFGLAAGNPGAHANGAWVRDAAGRSWQWVPVDASAKRIGEIALGRSGS